MKKEMEMLIKTYAHGFKGTVRVFVEKRKAIFFKRFQEIFKGNISEIPAELRKRKVIGKPYFNADNELIIDTKEATK
jgi:predicted HTH domain antitoxin